MAVLERDLVYHIPASKPETEFDVSYLTPEQVGIYKLRAMGFSEKEIATKTYKAYSTVKNKICSISGGYNQMEIIAALMNSGGIKKSEIAEGLNFESYDELTIQRKQTLEQIARRESWGQTGEEIAQSLHISLDAFKSRMEAIRKKLGVSNGLRLRVFMFLKAECEQGLQDFRE